MASFIASLNDNKAFEWDVLNLTKGESDSINKRSAGIKGSNDTNFFDLIIASFTEK